MKEKECEGAKARESMKARRREGAKEKSMKEKEREGAKARTASPMER